MSSARSVGEQQASRVARPSTERRLKLRSQTERQGKSRGEAREGSGERGGAARRLLATEVSADTAGAALSR
jgi:hypothetical protein